jgi:hypothetical protein
MGILVFRPSRNENESASSLHHEGIRVGEIIACRAWRVFGSGWFRRADDRLRSVYMQDYVWHPGPAATGDVQRHGVYSFKKAAQSLREYENTRESLLFGSVKIWGEIVEHEVGYRSQFAKIISLDCGDSELLEKYRAIYGLAKCVQDERQGYQTFQSRW